MVEEACIAWDPIPDVANEFWNVDVVHLEESSRSNGAGGLALIVASQWQIPSEEHGWSRKAWRIHFRGYRAYRMRIVGYKETKPLTRPDQRKATWEISPSSYLVEEGVPSAFDVVLPGVSESAARYHHYVVLTGGNAVYEIVGGSWTCEPVGGEWAHPFAPVPQ